MIDRTHTGQRVRTKTFVRTAFADLQKDWTGTVVYEMPQSETQPRHLIEVKWDVLEATSPVFPTDVEFI